MVVKIMKKKNRNRERENNRILHELEFYKIISKKSESNLYRILISIKIV